MANDLNNYKGCKIKIKIKNHLPIIEIDGEEKKVSQDADTNAYFSPDAPYERFGTVDELAKAIVDAEAEAKDK